MNAPIQPTESPAPQGSADRFFSGALRRMLRFLLMAGSVCTLFGVWRYGWPTGLGVGAGALIAYSNFRSLDRAVQLLTERVVGAAAPEQGYFLAGRFAVRYLVAGLAAYVIFRGSAQAFRGFLFGLCTPVLAMLIEAGCEAYAALRRGY